MCAVSTALLWSFRYELASPVKPASCDKGSRAPLRSHPSHRHLR
jgi:hypothetical protein